MKRTKKGTDNFGERTARTIASIRADYVLDPRGELLLIAAEEALRRWQQARAVVDREGLTTRGRDGLKMHPAATAEARARADLTAILGKLHLEEDNG